MSKINIPAGWKLVPVEVTEAMLIAARDWSICKLGRAVGNDGSSGCYAAMLAAAPTPPVDAVLGEPVATVTAFDWLKQEALEIFNGPETSQDVRDVIEWYSVSIKVIMDKARSQLNAALAAPVASRAVQAEPISAWMPPGRPWISDDGMETLQGVIAMLEPLEHGEATRSNKPDHLLATTHIGKATIKDAMRVLSFAVPMLKKVRHELR